jgi:hypothetical protein
LRSQPSREWGSRRSWTRRKEEAVRAGAWEGLKEKGGGVPVQERLGVEEPAIKTPGLVEEEANAIPRRKEEAVEPGRGSRSGSSWVQLGGHWKVHHDLKRGE